MKQAKIRTQTVVLMLAVFACLFAVFSCQSAKTLPDFEAMPQAQSDAITADITDIARITVGGLLRHDKVSVDDVIIVAGVLDFAAVSDGATGGPNLMVGLLKAAKVDDQDVLDGMALVDIALRHYANLGAIGLPLGPHARHALASVAVALREAAAEALVPFPPVPRP